MSMNKIKRAYKYNKLVIKAIYLLGKEVAKETKRLIREMYQSVTLK